MVVVTTKCRDMADQWPEDAQGLRRAPTDLPWLQVRRISIEMHYLGGIFVATGKNSARRS